VCGSADRARATLANTKCVRGYLAETDSVYSGLSSPNTKQSTIASENSGPPRSKTPTRASRPAGVVLRHRALLERGHFTIEHE
jgi:hypothetical protein